MVAKMNRRTFLKGLILTAAGLAVPPLALDEPVRRLWALDGTMLGAGAAQPEIVIVDLLAEAEAFQADMEAAAAAWAESAGRVFDAVKAGIDGLNQLAAFHAPDDEAVGDFSGFLFDGWDDDGTTPILRHSATGEELRFVADAFAGNMRVAAAGWYPARAPAMAVHGSQWNSPPRTIQGRYRA